MRSLSSMSPAEKYILQALNVEDAAYSVNEEVMTQIKSVCSMINRMLADYSPPHREKTPYVFDQLCSTEGLNDCAEITREGHPTIHIKHILVNPDPVNWESKLSISIATDKIGSLAFLPILVESSLTSRWGPNLEETDGTYCHTLSPDFDLELVKAIFRP